MKKVQSLKTILLLVCVVFLSSCGAKKVVVNNAPVVQQKEEEPKLVLKVAQANNEEHPFAAGCVAFKEKLEQLSQGNITAELYHGTMGKNAKDIMAKFDAGEVDVFVTDPSLVGIPEVELFSLEYLFSNNAHWQNAMDGMFGQELSSTISQKTDNRFHILGYWSSGIRNYYGKKPITKPEDLQGLKIRVNTSPVQVEFWQACGVDTQNVAWGDLYDALANGTVEGAENDYTGMMLKNHHKTSNGHYICETQHDITTRFFLMNGDEFDSLSMKQQDIIQEAANYATQIERQRTFEQTSSSKAQVIADGAEVVEADSIDIDAFLKIAEPIQDKFAKENGLEDYLQLARQAR